MDCKVNAAHFFPFELDLRCFHPLLHSGWIVNFEDAALNYYFFKASYQIIHDILHFFESTLK
jgi:hypothetical protein